MKVQRSALRGLRSNHNVKEKGSCLNIWILFSAFLLYVCFILWNQRMLTVPCTKDFKNTPVCVWLNWFCASLKSVSVSVRALNWILFVSCMIISQHDCLQNLWRSETPSLYFCTLWWNIYYRPASLEEISIKIKLQITSSLFFFYFFLIVIT